MCNQAPNRLRDRDRTLLFINVRYVVGLACIALSIFLLVFVKPAAFWTAEPQPSGDSSVVLSEAKAKALQAELQELSSPAIASANVFRPLVITDTEANSYLKYRGQGFLPEGVSATVLHIMPAGIYGTAIVNFNQLKIGTNQDDMGSKLVSLMFQGTQRVSAFGKLESANGKATLQIEDVRIGTTQLNDWLVNWLLQYYIQSKFKIDLSKPLPLPDHVTRIALSPGRATLMRSASKR
jgi:hypothetical protein